MPNRTMAATGRNNKPQFDDEHENDDHGRASQVISDPNAVVDGKTISQWTQEWMKIIVRTPGGAPPTGLNDPTGEIARSINHEDSRMYFITGAPSGAERFFHVDSGQSVFLSIRGVVDTEGPGIAPSLPGFSDAQAKEHVAAALDLQTISNVTLEIDGKPVTDLRETYTGIFNAGISLPGSVADLNFGATPGVMLATTGVKSYSVVFKDLSEGEHIIKTSSSLHIAQPLAPDITLSGSNITHIIVG